MMMCCMYILIVLWAARKTKSRALNVEQSETKLTENKSRVAFTVYQRFLLAAGDLENLSRL